jgi:outer membrane protein OmpA-like peptidoglycan-associated protein
VLLLAIGAILWTLVSSNRSGNKTLVMLSPTPVQTPIPTPTPTPTPAPTETPTPTPTPTPTVTPTSPPPETAGTPINLDLTGEGLEQVKTAIMKRIQLQPTLSQIQKDTIIEEVQSAKKMGRLAVVSFPTSVSNLSPDDVAVIMSQVNTSQVKQLLKDPKIVLAVLGYADLQGDNQKNLDLSYRRAEAVVEILVTKCGVLNELHAVPMGGTDLFDPHGFARNRTVEVWAGQP